MTSLYLLLNRLTVRDPQPRRPSAPRVILGTVFGLTVAWGVLVAYDAAASSGLLGADAQARYYAQTGSLGVLIGGRSEILVSTQAVIDSPVLGHGSWAKDFKYVDLLAELRGSLGYDVQVDPQDVGLIPTHSYILGAWVEGGFLGALFWLAIAVVAIRLLLVLLGAREALAPLLVFSTVLLLSKHRFLAHANAGPVDRPLRDRTVPSRTRLDASICAGVAWSPARSSGNVTKVSIVTISFNQGRHLPLAIASVLSQDHPDIEYIVVDPGSTDGSLKIIESHAHKLDRVVLEADTGPADGLNHGFQLATGDVLAYVNADDALLPCAVREAVEYLDANRDVDVVYGDGYLVDGEGRVTRVIESSPFSLRRFSYGHVMVLQPATFIRRSAFDRAGGFNPANPVSWDAELIVDIATNGGRLRHVKRRWAAFAIYAETITGSRRLAERATLERKRLFRTTRGRDWRSTDDLVAAVVRVEKWLVSPGTTLRRLMGVLVKPPRRRLVVVEDGRVDLSLDDKAVPKS